MEQNPGSITSLNLAKEFEKIYEEFTQSVKALGAKNSGKKHSSKFGSSMVHWVAGNGAKTEREQLCEKFLSDVQKHMELFLLAVESDTPENSRQACEIAVDVIMQPVPAKSDATTDLMKRAMIGQARPLFPYLLKEKKEQLKEQLITSYSRWNRLPLEKEIIHELEK